MSSARIKLRISNDGMAAFADVSPGEPCTARELQDTLRAAGVTFTADPALQQRLAERLTHRDFNTSHFVVAVGQPPTPGVHGHFEPAFPIGIQPGHLDDAGKMDFFDRELLKPVAQGELIGQLMQPVKGIPGRGVDGRSVETAAVRPSKLRTGPGVTLAADGRMYAARAGVVVYSEEQQIDISQQFVHNGDVDLRSGSLHMEGSINLRGSVQRQFSVRATGNVDVQGHVESGSVLAAGAIRIGGRVRSGDSGMICAEGDLSVHHAEGAHLRCGGLLKLQSAVNSELQAAKIQVLGTLRGGSATSEVSTVVLEAGSARAETATVLASGMPIERPLSDVRLAIEAAKTKRALTHHAGVRDGDERGKGGKVGRANAAIEQRELARKAELANRRAELLPSAFVQVLGVAHPGVTIQLGVHSLQVDQTVARVRFVYDPERKQIRQVR